jgi:hypothetical protein
VQRKICGGKCVLRKIGKKAMEFAQNYAAKKIAEAFYHFNAVL